MLLNPNHIEDAQVVIKVLAAHIVKGHEVGWQEVIALGEDQFVIRKSGEQELMTYRIVPDAIIKTNVKPKPTPMPSSGVRAGDRAGVGDPFQSVGLRVQDPHTGEWYNTKDRERAHECPECKTNKGMIQRVVEYFGDF